MRVGEDSKPVGLSAGSSRSRVSSATGAGAGTGADVSLGSSHATEEANRSSGVVIKEANRSAVVIKEENRSAVVIKEANNRSSAVIMRVRGDEVVEMTASDSEEAAGGGMGIDSFVRVDLERQEAATEQSLEARGVRVPSESGDVPARGGGAVVVVDRYSSQSGLLSFEDRHAEEEEEEEAAGRDLEQLDREEEEGEDNDHGVRPF